MQKPKTEYRISCPSYGTKRHSTHVTNNIKTEEDATKKADAQNRHYEHLSKEGDQSVYSYYRSEIGWKVEKRTTTAWEEVT